MDTNDVKWTGRHGAARAASKEEALCLGEFLGGSLTRRARRARRSRRDDDGPPPPAARRRRRKVATKGTKNTKYWEEDLGWGGQWVDWMRFAL